VNISISGRQLVRVTGTESIDVVIVVIPGGHLQALGGGELAFEYLVNLRDGTVKQVPRIPARGVFFRVVKHRI
jgi:hypothetical protein